MAQTTEITITGATAFRQATMQAIYDAYTSVGALGTGFNVCCDFTGNNLSQLIASNKAVFSGTFPGILGTTVIRTSFNGSTEGLNAIAGNNDPTFLTVGALGTPGAVIKGGVTTPNETLRPKFAFSDVYQSTSPVDNVVLNPVGTSSVGVVTFTMIAKRFVVPSKLAALIRSNLSDDGSLLRIKFNQSFQCLFYVGLFLEEVAC
jgi:hypothetical protein